MINIINKIFKKDIDFSTCNEKNLMKFIEQSTREDKNTKDYTSQYWGHTCVTDDTINKSPVIFNMHGFDGAGQIITMGKSIPKLRVGDEILLNLKGGKIGIYFILEIRFTDDPSDMFFGKMVGIGYKE